MSAVSMYQKIQICQQLQFLAGRTRPITHLTATAAVMLCRVLVSVLRVDVQVKMCNPALARTSWSRTWCLRQAWRAGLAYFLGRTIAPPRMREERSELIVVYKTCAVQSVRSTIERIVTHLHSSHILLTNLSTTIYNHSHRQNGPHPPLLHLAHQPRRRIPHPHTIPSLARPAAQNPLCAGIRTRHPILRRTLSPYPSRI